MSRIGGMDGYISSYGLGVYDPYVNSIRQLHPDEQPFTMPERHGKASTYAIERNEESTDSTGIVLSEEAKDFLAQLKQEEKEASKYISSAQESVLQDSTAEKARVQDSYSPNSLKRNTSAQPANSEEVSTHELTEEEKEIVKELEKRDAEVRAHEEAHARAGAGLTGRPSYEYEIGPDGKRYAIGGSVQIETSTVSNNPEATAKKADKIKAAALAADSPSAQDYAVANAAMQMKTEANRQKSAERTEEFNQNSKLNESNNNANAINLTKSSEQNSSSMLSSIGFNAMSLHAQYNKAMQAENTVSQEQASKIYRDSMSAPALTSSAIIKPEESSKANEQGSQSQSMINQEQSAQNPYQEQWKKYAHNAYSQVQTRGFARAV